MSPFLGTLIGNGIIALIIFATLFIVHIFESRIHRWMYAIKAITVGVLLGIIFLEFLPEITGSHEVIGTQLGVLLLGGMATFYTLEIFLHWHHCNDHHNDAHIEAHKNGILMFAGTMLHNGLHGIVLFSAFAISIPFGWATTFAVALHAFPQNVVNLIMNHHNPKYAYIGAFGGIFGALLTFPIAPLLLEHKFVIITWIAGGLLYTALADIFPTVKKHGNFFQKIYYLLLIGIGILLFVGFESLSHMHTHGGHSHEIHSHEEHDHGGDDHEEHDHEEHDHEEHDHEEHDHEEHDHEEHIH